MLPAHKLGFAHGYATMKVQKGDWDIVDVIGLSDEELIELAEQSADAEEGKTYEII